MLIDVGKSPYEAMFGCTAKSGLASTGIFIDEKEKLNSEEDIVALFNTSNYLDHDNEEKNDLVSVENLGNEENLETENEFKNTGNY